MAATKSTNERLLEKLAKARSQKEKQKDELADLEQKLVALKEKTSRRGH